LDNSTLPRPRVLLEICDTIFNFLNAYSEQKLQADEVFS
jgi:hypothetical protein